MKTNNFAWNVPNIPKIIHSTMGMSVIANRFKGVVDSVVESVLAAKMSRAINNANALCLGSVIWGEWMDKEAVDAFLNTKFTAGELQSQFFDGINRIFRIEN